MCPRANITEGLSLVLAFCLFFLLPPKLGLAQIRPDAPLEQRRSLLINHRIRLEKLFNEQTKRISRLKAQTPGVKRDFQLNTALQENLELATKLTSLRNEIHAATQKLIKAYERAAAQTSDPAERKRLLWRKTQIAGELSSSASRIALHEQANPLDSPEDLDEKADLLKDSEEKIRRQLRQVQTRLALLEQRARLQRHSHAIDNNPFIEDSPRRTGQIKRNYTAATTTTSSGDKETTASPPSGTLSPESSTTNTPSNGPPATAKKTSSPSTTTENFSNESTAPQASGGSVDRTVGSSPSSWYGPGSPPTSSPETSPSGGNTSTNPGTSPTDIKNTWEVVVSIRDVLDPAVLQELKQSSRSNNLQTRIMLLKKANERLNQVAQHLAKQSKYFRDRANQLRKQK